MQSRVRLPALAALIFSAAFSAWGADTPVKGGTLVYLEQQPHTNLYPPAGGFYPNGGILNQITDKLTWQNPKTLEVEPWIAQSWVTNADKTEDNPLVSDLRVRQALLHATNARQVVDTLFSANYPQATSVLASTAAGYVNLSDKLTFDQAKSRQLLDDAGWKPAADGIREKAGQRLALTVYESLPQPQNKEVLQLIAQQWRQVGVALSVKAGDAGSRVIDNLDPLKTPLTVSEVGRADPDVVKSMFFPANRDALLQRGGSSDKVQQFRDDKLNDLLSAISAEVDTPKRLQLTGDAQRYLLDNAYVIPIFEEPQVFAGAPWVQGVSFEAVGRPSFYGAWLEKH